MLHEVIDPGYRSCGTLSKVVDVCTPEGARSKDPLKYQKDAALLEAALKDEPNNTRYLFYLAQSYRDAGNKPQALINYEKRVKLGGWEEEVYWSLLQIAILQEELEMPSQIFIGSYNQAFRARTSRPESLYYLSRYYRKNGNYNEGYQIAKLAMSIPQSKDLLFVQQWMPDYGIPLELSICAYWLGQFKECEEICLEILKRSDLPANIRECVERNLGFAKVKLLEHICAS